MTRMDHEALEASPHGVCVWSEGFSPPRERTPFPRSLEATDSNAAHATTDRRSLAQRIRLTASSVTRRKSGHSSGDSGRSLGPSGPCNQ